MRFRSKVGVGVVKIVLFFLFFAFLLFLVGKLGLQKEMSFWLVFMFVKYRILKKVFLLKATIIPSPFHKFHELIIFQSSPKTCHYTASINHATPKNKAYATNNPKMASPKLGCRRSRVTRRSHASHGTDKAAGERRFVDKPIHLPHIHNLSNQAEKGIDISQRFLR